MTDDANPFWQNSLRIYGTPGFSDIAIGLQNRLGVNVNFILFSCWLGATGRGALDPAAMKASIDATGGWSERVVKVLRAVRDRLKQEPWPAPGDGVAALRKKVLGCELDAEQLEHLVLAASVAGRPVTSGQTAADRAAAVARNLVAYGAASGIDLAGETVALTAIVAAAVPDLGGDGARDAVATALR